MRTLGIIFAALVALVAVFALYISSRPSEFSVERSTTIAAPPAAVFPLVNDFHAWPRWSPWEKLDPAMQREYSGAASGEGSSYHWLGDGNVGEGHMTITKSVPGERIEIELVFVEPMPGTNQTLFTFQDAGASTTVVWRMSGTNGFAGKLFGLIMDMDQVIGASFEEGLAALKAAAEADARAGQTPPA